ncbi:hypothetical protein T484DRAFT_1839400 [Baffinella frigidus]|nr:hypothetical protein T484DRAFT_1839400 [Cryptophyta sp. CCMP2293]
MPAKRKADGPVCPITDFPVDDRLVKRLKGDTTVSSKKMMNIMSKKFDWKPAAGFSEADRDRVVQEYVAVLQAQNTAAAPAGASSGARSPAAAPVAPITPKAVVAKPKARVPSASPTSPASPPARARPPPARVQAENPPAPREPTARSVPRAAPARMSAPPAPAPTPPTPPTPARQPSPRAPSQSPAMLSPSPRGKSPAPAQKDRGVMGWIYRMFLLSAVFLTVLCVLGLTMLYSVHGDDSKGLVVGSLQQEGPSGLVTFSFSTVRKFASSVVPERWMGAGGALEQYLNMFEWLVSLVVDNLTYLNMFEWLVSLVVDTLTYLNMVEWLVALVVDTIVQILGADEMTEPLGIFLLFFLAITSALFAAASSKPQKLLLWDEILDMWEVFLANLRNQSLEDLAGGKLRDSINDRRTRSYRKVTTSPPPPPPSAQKPKEAPPPPAQAPKEEAKEEAYKPFSVPCSDFSKYDCTSMHSDYAACERREDECAKESA